MSVSRMAFVGLLATTVAACAAQSKAPAAPSARAEAAQPGYAVAPSAAGPAQAGYPPAPPPPPTADAAQPAPSPAPQSPSQPGTPSSPAGGTSSSLSRSLALANAAREVDSSQRELDVAAGDCRNACRALGSMDRATGRLCELAQGAEEGRRCEDARKRVYSARDRVKSTCGGCDGSPSVERSAPIPSLR